ncbi:MAG: hypothetical protein HWN66_06905 [Candidatus Helarchaeota archaeon]|nr:hypothetical protein [Candidatus Helarchaeota archaeon]
MKCPICGKGINNPYHIHHIRSRRHQAALKIQETQKDLSTPILEPSQPTSQVADSLEFLNLKSRIRNMEKQYEVLKEIIVILVDELDKEGVLTDIIVSRFLGNTSNESES